ncbi:MAG: protein translocase subunit SecF [Limnochordales bacterium]|nr:protein translocase subunit SecF [Limnochordales bacterium]
MTAVQEQPSRGRVYDIVGKAKYFFTLSAVLVIASIILVLVRGLNWGIDFTGGTLLDRGFARPVTVAELRAALTSPELADLQLERAGIQVTEDGKQAIIRVPELTVDEISRVDSVLRRVFGNVDELRTETVGPVVSRELLNITLLAVLLGLGGILIYVGFRFEYRFAVAGVLALFHDVVVTVGVFALVQREVNIPFMAALLTVVGYSINDTIVIFDRIRELLRLKPRLGPAEIANEGILQTLSRSINTSVTTLLATAALYFLGGTTIKDLSLAMLIGVIVGSYSSIFIASPIWVFWRRAGKRPVG